MWDFDSIFGKALVYFERGRDVSHSDDDEFAIWHLLGLEFLLRAPLARVHPALLAAPEGDSILHAAGITTAGDPKSIPTHTVLSRLGKIVDGFTKEQVDDATFLINVRNAELHTGDAAVANVRNDIWLPKLIRVAAVIAAHLSTDLEDILGDDVVKLGKSLVDAEDKRLAHEIQCRIETAKAFFAGLDADELTARRRSIPVENLFLTSIPCPGCNTSIALDLESVRATAERYEDDHLVRDIVKVATGLECPVCNLKLENTAEIRAAGLEQQYTKVEYESLEDRYREEYVGEEYGND